MQRHQFDENQPKGAMSLANLRSSLRGLHQLDMLPLRPTAKYILDDMEYSTDAAAQAVWSGTGVTVTKESSIIQEGTYSLKCVIDGTGNRKITKTHSINLSAFLSVPVWTRCSATASAIQFWVSDGTNESYWDITTHASANTWEQDTLTLASPDSNSGSPANLAAITSWGFRGLDASATYYFDTVKAIVGMKVAVENSVSGSFYKNVYIGKQPLEASSQGSPTLSAPSGNPRIDILTINSSGTLAFITGTEASSPSPAWASLGQDVIPIALVYCKTTMTKVLDYEDKDTDSNQGYIYADLRPFMVISPGKIKGSDVASASTVTLGDGDFFDITGTTTITSITAKNAGKVIWLQFDSSLTVTDGSNLKLNGNFNAVAESVLQLVSDGTNWYEVSRSLTTSTFLGLTDTPSSFSGQSKKYCRVNVGETAIEFVSDPFDTTSGHDHDGTDSKKVLATNLDPTGITDGHFIKRNGSGISGAEIINPTSNAKLFTTVGANSWVCPTGVTSVLITAVGGGGGGGGGEGGGGGAKGASGGAGGAWCKRYPVAVTPGNTYTVIVGAKGVGGTSQNNGTAGGNTTFNADGGTLTCGGGGAGQHESSVATTGGSFSGTISSTGRLLRPQFVTDESHATPSAGASGSGGTGGTGGNGLSSSPTTSNGMSGGAGQNADHGAGGGGGGSPWGTGGNGNSNGGGGAGDATGYGAGGGGSDDDGSFDGGDGSQGFLLIEW